MYERTRFLVTNILAQQAEEAAAAHRDASGIRPGEGAPTRNNEGDGSKPVHIGVCRSHLASTNLLSLAGRY